MYEDISTTVTEQKETNMLHTEQRGTSSFLTTDQDMSASAQQGPTALVTTQLSPTLDQNTHVRHRSLVAVAGTSVSLSCSSPDRVAFRWEYCPLGSRKSKRIDSGDKINKGFGKAARVSISDCGETACTINVRDLQLEDAGRFSCILSGDDKSWSLTILGKYRYFSRQAYSYLYGLPNPVCFVQTRVSAGFRVRVNWVYVYS